MTFTDEQLRQAVALLTDKERAVLAQGPTEDPDDCRVCDAFDDYLWGVYDHGSTAQRRRQRVALLLSDWHQGWDLKRRDEERRIAAGRSFGTFLLGQGPECYARCLAIYCAAGWDG